MPDTLTPEELAAIREGAWRDKAHHGGNACQHVRALLAYIDAMTVAVEALQRFDDRHGVAWLNRAAVLAILRGEQ